jgi:hypothetical protein
MMTALPITRAAQFGLSRIAWRFALTLDAHPLRLLAYRLAGSGQAPHWRSLDDRLLQDIGVSTVAAEICRLEARMGAAETGDLEPLACRGLAAGQFLRGLRRSSAG